ncbi:hypothetical protein [Prevotella dentasini]|uniref:hypothetical protein n=1 Tax=Prevotella dentasini TaxID=589537 RepID=UPI0011DDA2FF|nr:hypothetical protein [Prevotella dentasini]
MQEESMGKRFPPCACGCVGRACTVRSGRDGLACGGRLRWLFVVAHGKSCVAGLLPQPDGSLYIKVWRVDGRQPGVFPESFWWWIVEMSIR